MLAADHAHLPLEIEVVMFKQHIRGQVLVWTVVLLPVFLVLTGLVFDGGVLWQQYTRARWAASAAAVAAASEIDPNVFANSGRMVLRPGALNVAANYAARNDPDLHITSVYIIEGKVGVQGWTEAKTVFLSLFGIQGYRLNVRAVERPAWGVSAEGQ
ncbi:MAG TPA: TadE/TadG family type IV pilus assembly protein [Verrucomicrobiota bacterium]|nr:TadE/TadG family type IV pilus assembly protein [Verrucomicrobiota bacterium]